MLTRETWNVNGTTEVDWVADDLEADLEEARQTYDVDLEVVNERGPGGGAPVVAVSGTYDNVRRFLIDYWDGDEAEVDALYYS